MQELIFWQLEKLLPGLPQPVLPNARNGNIHILQMLLIAVLLNYSSSLTFPCVWRGCIYSVYLDGLSHLCPVCSEGFEESYLICVFLLSICTWGFVFTILCYSLFCFLFFLFERNYWKIVFYLLLFFIWSIISIFCFPQLQLMPEWKFLVCYTFHHFSELP